MARALHNYVRRKRKRLFVSVLGVVVLLGIALAVYRELGERRNLHRGTTLVHQKPEAPPDLEKLRGKFSAGLDALAHKNGADAAKQLGSFTFGKRGVEEYRLWFLGQAQQLANDHPHARATLAQLWARDPRGAYRADAGFALPSLYAESGDTRHVFETATSLALRAASSDNGANARMAAMQAALAAGDVSGVLFAARSIAIKNPASAPAGDAVAVVQSLTSLGPDRPIKLTPGERLERAVSFLRDGDAQNCFDEIAFMEQLGTPADLKAAVQ